MITITMHGDLADRFIYQFEADVQTASEAIAAIKVNFSNFSEYLNECAKQGIDFVLRVGYEQIGEDQLAYPFSKKVKSLTIIPVISGAGGGLGKIILGVALIGIGIATGGAGFLGLSSTSLFLTGGALLLGGIASMFGQTKKPEDDEKDGKKSLIFGSPAQTVQEGGRVPYLAGVHLTGIYIISARVRSYLTDGD